MFSASSDFSDRCSWTKPTAQRQRENSWRRLLLTSQDDADGDDHTGGIVKLSHERADDAASKQQEDQRVLVHLLGKLDVQRV